MNTYVLQTTNKQIFGILQTRLTIEEVKLWFEKFKHSTSSTCYDIEEFVDYLTFNEYDKEACRVHIDKRATIQI